MHRRDCRALASSADRMASNAGMASADRMANNGAMDSNGRMGSGRKAGDRTGRVPMVSNARMDSAEVGRGFSVCSIRITTE